MQLTPSGLARTLTKPLFVEQVSGKGSDRAELANMIDFMREGDVVVTTRKGRIARSMPDL